MANSKPVCEDCKVVMERRKDEWTNMGRWVVHVCPECKTVLKQRV